MSDQKVTTSVELELFEVAIQEEITGEQFRALSEKHLVDRPVWSDSSIGCCTASLTAKGYKMLRLKLLS